MSYEPRDDTVKWLLTKALEYVNSVQYQVTIRWVFYRMLQEGLLALKSDYKRLLGYLSKARKSHYGGWHPWTLVDDTRQAVLIERYGMYEFNIRGQGFRSADEWLERLKKEINCPLDRWATQPSYIEIWFEAAAMEQQFRFYADDSIPLLAFRGDISINPKWVAAERLVNRWTQDKKPVNILYFGDLDEKGLQIPQSAAKDVQIMMAQALWRKVYQERGWTQSQDNPEWKAEWGEMDNAFTFTRLGLNQDQVAQYNVPENPDRPGTYQWEGLNDDAAQELIGIANDYVDQDALELVKEREQRITDKVRGLLADLDLGDMEDDDAPSSQG